MAQQTFALPLMDYRGYLTSQYVSTWDSARGGYSALVPWPDSDILVAESGYSFRTVDEALVNFYYCSRGFMAFDISEITANYANIELISATLRTYFIYAAYYKYSAVVTGDINIDLFRCTVQPPFDESSLSKYAGTALASVVLPNVTGREYSYNTYKTFTLNADGLEHIQNSIGAGDAAVTFVMREQEHDADNLSPGSGTDYRAYGGRIVGYPNPYNSFTVPMLTLKFNVPVEKGDCESRGWYWYNNACNAELPNTEAGCESYGEYWYNGTCNETLPDNETDCELNDFVWFGGICHANNYLGIVSCELIDSEQSLWLVAGHAVESIEEVFVTIEGSAVEPQYRPGGYVSYPSYTHPDGKDGKIAVIQFTVNEPSSQDLVWCNVIGLRGVDANPIDVMTNFMQAYLGMTHADYSAALFSAARSIAEARGYRSAGVVLNNQTSPKEILENIAHSVGASLFMTLDGKLGIKFLD